MSRFKHIIDTPSTNTQHNYTTQTFMSTPQSTPYSNILQNQTQQPSQNQLNWPQVFPKSIIGLEYDGVINVDIGKPITSPEEWVPIEGSLEAIRTMRLKGYKVIILSDQGAIKRGEQTHDNVAAFHEKAMQMFGQAGIFSIDGFFYAESDLKEDIYAKPNIGMFDRAENEIFRGQARFKHGGFYVGHRIKDLKAATRAGANPVLVRTGKGKQTEEELQKFSAEKLRKSTKIFDNLLQFAQKLP